LTASIPLSSSIVLTVSNLCLTGEYLILHA
jgi:hypothetical protein